MSAAPLRGALGLHQRRRMPSALRVVALVDAALEQVAKTGFSANFVDARGSYAAKGKDGDKILVAVVRGEYRLAHNAERAKMCYNAGNIRYLAQSVGVALAVNVDAVLVADEVELVHIEKFGERLVFVRVIQMGGENRVAAGPITGLFHGV